MAVRDGSAPGPTRPPVVVVVDTGSATTAAGRSAVRWAAREAVRLAAPLRIVVPTGGTPTLRRSALVQALGTAHGAGPGAEVTTVLSDEAPARARRIAAADAAMIVLAEDGGAVDDLILTAHCPVVVVPEQGGDPSGPVLLAAGPFTPERAVAFAFAAAQERNTGLLAMRTWSDPLLDLGLLTGDRTARWDEAAAAVRQDVADQLGFAALAHPDVPVTTLVADDRCADLLADLAPRARLLVLGRPARGTVLGRLVPSPALAPAHRPPCPVAVVPPDGPLRPTLLPRRRVGLADLRR